jgi:hypothetical protein
MVLLQMRASKMNKLPTGIEDKLNRIATLAEDLSAELYDSPDTARKFAKVAAYSRKISTCLRIHGQVPLERPGSPVIEAARSIDQLMRGFQGALHAANAVKAKYEQGD